MIDPELIEQAEYNEYYTYETNISNELNIPRSVQKDILPNAYYLIQNYSDYFVIEDNILKPKNEEIHVETIDDAHYVGQGPNEKTFPVDMFIYAHGSLELNEKHNEVIDGDMEINVHLYK